MPGEVLAVFLHKEKNGEKKSEKEYDRRKH